MAWILRKPLLIHEQNAIPGLTNKWLAMIADQVLCGFPDAFGTHIAARPVGNPVRDEISALPPPEKRLAGRRGNLRLLVIGGSQGAKIFNDVVPAAIRAMPAEIRLEVWHQCGRNAAATVQAAYGDAPARVAEFIDNMAEAYAWADVVLCRAGAMTVAELAASGSAAILVPYLYAVDDHQTANARFLSERDAAVLVPSPQLTPERAAELLTGFAANRELLMKMAVAARHLAVTDAAETVAAACRRMINA
jgi:UDP-N-acetylglucosamine--N-acetylmuramyl-(pentapeptide) pyrophosphoryl-undecaprenol N-acetylglucosamine transferase